MKKVKWIDETREIPNCGIAEYGKEIELPDQVAAAFIKQGQAETIKSKVVSKAKTKGRNEK